MAFRRKREALSTYDPDLVVVPECECPDTVGEWDVYDDWRWIGSDEHRGLGVFARGGVSLSYGRAATVGGTLTMPIRTDGELDLLAVWAKDDEADPRRRYVGQVFETLRAYDEFLDDRTAVVGDFNWNDQWDDSPKSPLYGTLADVRARLEEYGLASAYHTATDCAFGDESDPTFFMHKKRSREYHIDYAFLPSDLAERATVSVGTYDEWIDASDHVPLVVEW